MRRTLVATAALALAAGTGVVSFRRVVAVTEADGATVGGCTIFDFLSDATPTVYDCV